MQMTAEQALQILTDVTARVPLVRADQQTVLTALETLRRAVTPKPAGEPGAAETE